MFFSPRLPKVESGAALISALFIMVFCSLLAIFLLLDQKRLFHQSRLMLNSDRMALALQDVQNWGLNVTKEHSDIRKVNSFHRINQGMEISGMVYALGGRFNLNALQHPENIFHFSSVLSGAFPNWSKKEVIFLSYAIARWILPSFHMDKYYLSQHPAYRSANRVLSDISELRLIQGMTKDRYVHLVLGAAPYVTALPTVDASININYASAPTFMSAGNISLEEAKNLVRCRDSMPFFLSVDDFIQRCAPNLSIFPNRLTVDNLFYAVKGHVKEGDQQLSMQILIVVDTIENKRVSKIIWREYNSE